MLNWSDFQMVESQIRYLLLCNVKHTILKISVLKIFCLKSYTKWGNKASCNELQTMQEWDRKKRRKQSSSAMEIWYLICKLIPFSSPARFFFFHLLRSISLFLSFCFFWSHTLPPAQLESPQRSLAEVISQKLFKLWLEYIYWFFFFFNDQRNEDFWKKIIWDSASGLAIQTLLNLWEPFIRQQVLILSKTGFWHTGFSL